MADEAPLVYDEVLGHERRMVPGSDSIDPTLVVPEVYDSDTPPSSPTFPYLRFERDVNGDIVAVYLGVSA